MKKFLITYENERGEIFEDEIEADSRKESRELANDSIWDMGGSVINVVEIDKEDCHETVSYHL